MFKKFKPLFFTACMGILGAVALQFSLSVQAAHAIPPHCDYSVCAVDILGQGVCLSSPMAYNCFLIDRNACNNSVCDQY